MLRRTETPLSLARSHVQTWNVEPWCSDENNRPASKQAKGYDKARRDMLDRYELFAASQAPTVSASELYDATRTERIAILVPIAFDGENLAMVHIKGQHWFS